MDVTDVLKPLGGKRKLRRLETVILTKEKPLLVELF